MRNNNNRRAKLLPQLHHLPHNLRLRGHVQSTGRLVRQQQQRLKGHRHRNPHALAHTPGKLEGITPHDVLRVGQAHFFQHIKRHFAGFFLRHAPVRADILHELTANSADGVDHRPGILKNHGNLRAAQLPPLLLGIAEQGFALKKDIARRHAPAAGQAAEDRAHNSRLAAAALPHNAANFARLQLQIEMLDNRVLRLFVFRARIRNAYILNAQHIPSSLKDW